MGHGDVMIIDYDIKGLQCAGRLSGLIAIAVLLFSCPTNGEQLVAQVPSPKFESSQTPPPAFDTINARDQWVSQQREAIQREYLSHLSKIIQEYQACEQGGFHECETRIVALDEQRNLQLEKLETHRRQVPIIIPSKKIRVGSDLMCLAKEGEDTWRAVPCKTKPATAEITVDGRRQCLVKAGPGYWREATCAPEVATKPAGQ